MLIAAAAACPRVRARVRVWGARAHGEVAGRTDCYRSCSVGQDRLWIDLLKTKIPLSRLPKQSSKEEGE